VPQWMPLSGGEKPVKDEPPGAEATADVDCRYD
jgi:hypothetical protein